MKLKINFYLKSGSYTLVPVMALISFGYSEYDVKTLKKVYKPIRYYTSIKVPRNEWDFDTKFPKSKALQNELVLFEKKVIDCYKFLELRGDYITPENFKETLDIKLGKKELIDKLRIRMVDYVEDYIIPSNEFKDSTKTFYTQIKNKIIELEYTEI